MLQFTSNILATSVAETTQVAPRLLLLLYYMLLLN